MTDAEWAYLVGVFDAELEAGEEIRRIPTTDIDPAWRLAPDHEPDATRATALRAS